MTDIIKIEKGIPIPPAAKGRGAGRSPAYPFRSMEVGDSFSVPLTGQTYQHSSHDMASIRVAVAVTRIQKRTSLRFSTRLDREQGVVRCWRVA